MKYLYAITEEDVDGCDSSVTEIISSESPLTDTEQEALKRCLDNVKEEASNDGEDLETEDMIQDAMDRFETDTGKKLAFASDAVCGYIKF